MKDGFVKAAAATRISEWQMLLIIQKISVKMIDETVANGAKSHCISGVVCDGDIPVVIFYAGYITERGKRSFI